MLSKSFHIFEIGKDFTCELEEALIHLLNRQINLVKGYNKQTNFDLSFSNENNQRKYQES